MGEIWKENHLSKGGEDESWRGGRMGGRRMVEEKKTKGGEERAGHKLIKLISLLWYIKTHIKVMQNII